MNSLATTTDAAMMSPIALFLNADFVVKGVIVALLLASVWSWAIIIGQWLSLGKTARDSEAFERDFVEADDVEAFARSHQASKVPSAQIFRGLPNGAPQPRHRRSTRMPRGHGCPRSCHRQSRAKSTGCRIV